MKYLIVQDWNNTHGNHAGMVHMCKMLCERYPNEYEMYVKPNAKTFSKVPNGFIDKVLNKVYYRFVRMYYQKVTYPNEYLKLCQPMFNKLKQGDEVFLLEYLIPWVSQLELARYLRDHFPYVRIYALSHLTTKFFIESIDNKENNTLKWAKFVDKMLTLGTSLSQYFETKGVAKNKISTGFHYVDDEYYHKLTPFENNTNKPLTIITMGALQRDYTMLAKVVKACPQVHWIICKGRKQIDYLFNELDNVELKGFMPEVDLRTQMDRADISLNLMEDTVGSNVITTSMAMGLAMIVTDVGSIRDYCSEDNALFCSNDSDSVISAINYLNENRDYVLKMKKNSLGKSQMLHINHINEWFCSLIG